MLTRQDKATLALIHAQAMGYGVSLDLDGSPRLGGIVGAPLTAEKIGLGADIAAAISIHGLKPSEVSVGKVPFMADFNLAEAGIYGQKVEAYQASPADLRKTSPWTPRVAFELIRLAVPGQAQHQEAANDPKCKAGEAEFKKMAPWDNIAGKANKATAAGSRFYDHAKAYAHLAAARGTPIGFNYDMAAAFV